MPINQEDTETLLRIVSGLNPTELVNVQNNITAMLQKTTATFTNALPKKLPDLHIPGEILLPFVEFLFLNFIQEIFHNFDGGDYATKNEEEATNTNKVSVFNMFDHVQKQTGQYPRIVVRATSLRTSPMFIGNAGPESKNNNIVNEATLSVPMTMTVMSPNYNECNVLGNVTLVSLLANLKYIMKLFTFQHIDFPVWNAPQKMEDSPDLFAGEITFDCHKRTRWGSKHTSKIFSEIFLRLVATVEGDLSDPIVQIIGNIKTLDPKLKNFLLSFGNPGSSL